MLAEDGEQQCIFPARLLPSLDRGRLLARCPGIASWHLLQASGAVPGELDSGVRHL